MVYFDYCVIVEDIYLFFIFINPFIDFLAKKRHRTFCWFQLLQLYWPKMTGIDRKWRRMTWNQFLWQFPKTSQSWIFSLRPWSYKRASVKGYFLRFHSFSDNRNYDQNYWWAIIKLLKDGMKTNLGKSREGFYQNFHKRLSLVFTFNFKCSL